MSFDAVGKRHEKAFTNVATCTTLVRGNSFAICRTTNTYILSVRISVANSFVAISAIQKCCLFMCINGYYMHNCTCSCSTSNRCIRNERKSNENFNRFRCIENMNFIVQLFLLLVFESKFICLFVANSICN